MENAEFSSQIDPKKKSYSKYFSRILIDDFRFLDEFKLDEFAKAGYISPQTIVLNKGTEALKSFAHSMEPYLRKLGLKTSLINTEIHLLDDYLLAQEGEGLTPEQAKILV